MICVYRYSYMLIDIHKHNIDIYIYIYVCLLSMHVDYMIPFFMCTTWSWWLGIKIPILMTSIGLIICQLYCFRNGCIPHVCVCQPAFLQFFRVSEIGKQSVDQMPIFGWYLTIVHIYCPCRIGYVFYKTENVQAHWFLTMQCPLVI